MFVMKRYTLMNVLTIMILLIGKINTQLTITTVDGANNPVCEQPQIFQQSLTELPSGSSTNIEYDAVSSFIDHENNQHTQIMVKGGSASEPFRFIYFDMHSVKQSVDCTGTGGYEFIKLINNFLFLKKVGSPSEYHICQFDPSQVANSVQSFRTKRIKIPTTLENNMVGILPYSVKQTTQNSEWIIYIAFDISAAPAFARYMWSTIDSAQEAIGSNNFDSLTQFQGIEPVIYNSVDGFAILNSDPTLTYQADISKLPKPSAGDIIKVYRTTKPINLIAVYSSGMMSAVIYIVLQNSQIQIDPQSFTSNTPFRDFYDGLSNVIIISDTTINWVYISTIGEPYINTASTAQIPISGLISVGFSDDMAIFTYNDKMVYYQITGPDAISKFFEYPMQNQISLLGQNYQKSFSLSCFCQIIKVATCYSSTFSCFLLRRGEQRCSNEVNFIL